MTTPTPADLSTCDSEPIHIPGAVQPHGVLLVLREKDLEVIQVSANTEVHLALRPADIIGKRLGAIFRQHIADQVLAATRLRHEQLRSMYLPSLLEHNGRRWTAFLSRSEGGLQLELEPDPYPQSDGAPDLHARLRNAVASLDSAETVTDFCQRAAETLRDLVRFDRVLVYQFLQDDSGMVRAEARREDLDTYLGLHYPASDIPQQARNLYLLNPFRLTVDVDAPPAPLVPVRNPITGGDLDLTFCALRATSPVHLEYLRNMGVAASMSLSIVREGRLWGLFACHHQSPRTVSHEVRVAAELLARLTSLQVASREAREQAGYVSVLTTVREQLAEKLTASGDFAAALTHGRNTLLTHIDASGAALCTGSKVILLGETPAREEVIELAGWLSSAHPEPIWSTDRLSLDYGPADDFRSVASGVLAMRVTDEGKEAVLWFRPEWLRTVSWAGNPEKPVENSGQRIHPRRSFALWQETVRGRSRPWIEAESIHATALREAMGQALLRHRAAEISRLNGELQRSNQDLEQFAYAASHDLQEPLRAVSSYSQLLARRYTGKLDADADQFIQFVVSGVTRMQALIKALLDYSRVAGEQRASENVDSGDALTFALEQLQERIGATGATVEHGTLPLVRTDLSQLSRVFQNLIGNSLKYAKSDVAPRIEVNARRTGNEWLFSVADNGIGFAPEHRDRIFALFQRLHGHAYEGTGIGLAMVRRIVERQGGRIWAESPGTGEGATFYFTVPVSEDHD